MNPIVMITPDELRALVTEAVNQALEDHDEKPSLLDRMRLARALCCSPSHVDTLRKEGLPTVWLGDAPRFILSDVLKWVGERESNAQ